MITELEQIQLTIKQAQTKVDLADSLDALTKNRHFKKVFTNCYFTDYALSLVKNRANISFQDEKVQNDMNMQLSAVGCVDQFMKRVKSEGIAAKNSIAVAREELSLAEQEEG